MGTKTFTQHILPLKDNLMRVAFRITNDVDIAELVVQEVMLKLWKERESWQVIDCLPAYCLMATRKLALKQVAETGRQLCRN